MSVRLVCPRCATRYSGIVDPACYVCAGVGLLAAAVPEGVEPAVAARAVAMHLGAWWNDSPEQEQRRRSLAGSTLEAPVRGSRGIASAHVDPNSTGRAAGQLLRDLGLRKRKPKGEGSPRRSRKEIAEAKESAERALAAYHARWQAQRAAARERAIKAKAAGRVLKQLADAHPDEFQELYETEEAFAVIEGADDLLVVDRYMRHG